MKKPRPKAGFQGFDGQNGDQAVFLPFCAAQIRLLVR